MFGSPGCLIPEEVRADVFLRDDVHAERVARVLVAARVVGVVVRVENVLHRQWADFLHLGEDVGGLAGELVVDDDEAVGGDADGDVARLVDEAIALVTWTAARHAGHGWPANDVEAVLHFNGAHRRFREHLDVLSQRKLLRDRDGGEHDETRGGGNSGSHAR
jgi:hypothetical protein